MDWQALLLTAKLASVTTAILLSVAVPFAAWVRLSASRMRGLAQALAALPLVLPPTVLGYYLLVMLGTRTAQGRAIAALLGHPLAFSFAGLVVGSTIYSLPFAVQPLVAGFGAVDEAMVDAARLLGASPLRIAGEILLPLGRRSVVAAALLSFLHTVGEFGVVLMLGGDIPGATRTLSIVLFDQVQDFNERAANQTSLLLLGLSLTALLVLYARPAAAEMAVDKAARHD